MWIGGRMRMGGWGQMWIGGRMRMDAQSSPHTPFLAPWRFLLLRRSCCPGDVAESDLKRRRTIGLKGDVEEGSDPIAALAERKAASDEANPYARRRVVLAWQPAERHAPGAQLHSTCVDSAEARCAQGSNAPSGVQCFPPRLFLRLWQSTPIWKSQCTFWCSALSDRTRQSHRGRRTHRNRLNAPFGAQRFPTQGGDVLWMFENYSSQCTFWCSVLSDPEPTF